MNVIYRERENGKIQAIISYKENGVWKQRSKGGFDRKKDAKDWVKNKSYEIIDLEKNNIIDSDIKLDKLFEIYIDNLEMLNKSYNTIKTFKTASNFFKESFNMPINKIRSYDITQFIVKKQKENNCNYTEYFSKLSILFNFAMNNLNIINVNPCHNIKIDKVEEDKRIKFITKDLYNKIINECDDKKLKLAYKVAYYTGMRKSEIFALNVNDIKDCIITVNNQIVSGQVTNKLKTKASHRKIPINMDLYKDLMSATIDLNGFIFYDIKQRKANIFLKKYNTSMHCFRHTRASILVSEGIDLKYISYVIGDNINTILKIYTKLNLDKIDVNFEKIRNL